MGPELSSSLSSMTSSLNGVASTGSLNRVSLKLPLTTSLTLGGGQGFQSHAPAFKSSPSSPSSGSTVPDSASLGPTLPFAHKNPNHASTAFDALSKMRQSNELCDVIINVDDKVLIPAHKVILAAISPYFQAMFKFNGESKVPEIIPVPQIKSDAGNSEGTRHGLDDGRVQIGC